MRYQTSTGKCRDLKVHPASDKMEAAELSETMNKKEVGCAEVQHETLQSSYLRK